MDNRSSMQQTVKRANPTYPPVEPLEGRTVEVAYISWNTEGEACAEGEQVDDRQSTGPLLSFVPGPCSNANGKDVCCEKSSYHQALRVGRDIKPMQYVWYW